MKVFSKVVGSIVSVVLLFVLFFGVASPMNSHYYTYSGEVDVNTLQEAYSIQENIINEAISVNAKVLEANITYTSPPKFIYRVMVTDNIPFKYGKQLASSGVLISFMLGVLIMWLFISYLALNSIWRFDKRLI
jgi:hypothetical protein